MHRRFTYRLRPWLLTLAPIFAGATAADKPRSLADLPLKACTPRTVADWIYGESVRRDANSAAGSTHAGEDLSKQLGHLAESRLQRDMQIIAQAAAAIEKVALGASDFKGKNDPEGRGVGLVGLLRQAESGETPDPSAPADRDCTLDLAIYREVQGAQAGVRSETQFQQTRNQPSVRGPDGRFDAASLHGNDHAAPAKAADESLARAMQAVRDWGNLLRFARASMLEYSALREDIAAGGGAKDYDYEKAINKAYAAADPPTQHAIEAWAAINQQIPDEASRDAKSAD